MPGKRRHREEEEPSVEDASARKRQLKDPDQAIRKQFEIFKDSNYTNDRGRPILPEDVESRLQEFNINECDDEEERCNEMIYEEMCELEDELCKEEVEEDEQSEEDEEGEGDDEMTEDEGSGIEEEISDREETS
ncbi:hypothetical protein N7527_007378 [Penicillium freii]|nr:hypothetical protein N7527_007378 [Penicillium freii]